MTRSFDEDEHDEVCIYPGSGRGSAPEVAASKPTKRRSRTPTMSYGSTISKGGVPTVVALKGGVRGGHSVAYAHHPQQPLGLSPGDYLSSGEGRPSDGLHSMINPKYWPKGLTNVGNTCYANAALQCLLSTALTSALLDPKTMPILRRYSSNPNLLAMGSGSVDSSDEDNDSDSDDGCGLSIDNDLDEEEDGIFMDSSGIHLSKSFSPTQGEAKTIEKTKAEKKAAKAKKKKKREARRAKSEDAAKRKERERRRMEETCKWLTRELTSIAQEYIEDSSSSLRQSPVSGSSFGQSGSLVGWLSSSYSQTLGLGGQESQSHGVVNPGSITRHPNRLSPCLNPYQQEDAHEFMRALISNLVMNGHNKQLSSLFDGLLESSVTCQTCGRASLTRDRYMDLSVDINDIDIATLDDALFEFTKDELLTEDNVVFCQRCRKKQSVTKGLRLATAPSILVVHLKRFAFNDYGRLVRLHKRIEFPQRLEIGDYMSNLNKARPPAYELVGVLVHQGQTCASGHYLSFVKKNGEWFKCNDSEVSRVDESTVMMQQAYILMYEVSGMRENSCFRPKALRKEASIMSTIESSDEATLPKGDFSVCGSTNWSASDKSTSRRSYISNRDGLGTYNNPFGTDHPTSSNIKNESTTESIMRLLKNAGVARIISDICCDSSSTVINEPDTELLSDKRHLNDENFNFSRHPRNTGRYAHECESVDTQDSLIRRQALLSRSAPNPIHVLEVEPSRKSRGPHRSQTAPRQRAESFQETSFNMVSQYSTYTPRGDGSTSDGVVFRKFPSNGNLKALNDTADGGSISSRSTLTKRSKESLRSRERHSFGPNTSNTRYNMNHEDLTLPPRNPGRQRRGKTTLKRK